MSAITITARWRFSSALHIGTGLSERGAADRTVRLVKGKPVIPGDAAKGATRMAAERLLRWLRPGTAGEAALHSLPRHPVLLRLFAPSADGVFYRFSPPRYVSGGQLVSVSSTRVDVASGVASDQSLRIMQSWTAGAIFEVKIRGFGGEWADANGRDYWDLAFLYAAAAATDGVGGKRSVGHGAVELDGLECTIPMPEISEAATVARLRELVMHEEGHRG